MPILWEQFDDGTNGEKVSTRGVWQDYTDGARYNSTQPYSGTLSAYNFVQYGDGYPAGFSTSYYVFPNPSDEIYMTYMFRHDGTDYRTGVDKSWRLGADVASPYHGGPGQVALSDSYIMYHSGVTAIYPADDNGTGRYFSAPEFGSSNYTRHQAFARYSSPAGTSNGYIWAAVGNQEKTFANLNNRPDGYDHEFRLLLLGLMHDEGSLNAEEYHHMYIDDVYIDNTLARVEIGNASAWSACTERVIQIPTSWNSNGQSITATLNQGAFPDGDAYLYIVNADGEVNENGWLINLGGSSDITAPNAPSGLSVS